MRFQIENPFCHAEVRYLIEIIEMQVSSHLHTVLFEMSPSLLGFASRPARSLHRQLLTLFARIPLQFGLSGRVGRQSQPQSMPR